MLPAWLRAPEGPPPPPGWIDPALGDVHQDQSDPTGLGLPAPTETGEGAYGGWEESETVEAVGDAIEVAGWVSIGVVAIVGFIVAKQVLK